MVKNQLRVVGCLLILLNILSPPIYSFAQDVPEIIRTISYTEILNAEMSPIANIERMKMSGDGTKIVFNTYAGKIYTINTDGTDLTEILSENGRGFLDISEDGSKIVFARNYGYEILVFNSSGGSPAHIADQLPIPTGGTTGPDIRLSPVIAGNTIYFVALAGGPDVAGVWSVGLAGGSLTQHFSYREMSQQLFGMDGNEYNGNIAFRQCLAVSADGSQLAFGTYSFQPAGHTITWGSGGLRILTDLAPADGGLALNHDGTIVAMMHPVSGESRTALSSMDISGGNQRELIYHISTGNAFQIVTDESLIFANGDPMPLMLLQPDGSGRLDIVKSPSLSATNDPFYRFCVGRTSSISTSGTRFSFLSGLHYNDYTRIWVADIYPGAGGSTPSISNISLEPNHVVVDAGTVSNFTAQISGGGSPVLQAGFSGFNQGAYEHIIGNSNSYYLWDDGTHGDVTASDGTYGAENVFTNLLENPNPSHPYMIRFSAATEHHVTVADVEPFYIFNTPTRVTEDGNPASPMDFSLEQNYPNPFNASTKIQYSLPKAQGVSLIIYDLSGREITTVVSEEQIAGFHEINFDGSQFSSGVYIYKLTAGAYSEAKKFILIK